MTAMLNSRGLRYDKDNKKKSRQGRYIDAIFGLPDWGQPHLWLIADWAWFNKAHFTRPLSLGGKACKPSKRGVDPMLF